MEQANPQNLAQAARMGPESVILAMHSRYEAAQAEYTQLDYARSSISADAKSLNDHAQKELLVEQDALRSAILRQVPDTWADAAALTFHVANSYDLIADAEGEDWDEREGEALRIGLQNLFDFIASEKIGRPEALGDSFSLEVARVRSLRRRRSGHAEG